MKVTVYHQDKDRLSRHKDVCDTFIKFLFSELPLKHDIKIFFLKNRIGHMTTGARDENRTIKVLVKDRINRDILRTLAHEWVHEYQMTILGREHGPNIGGINEDEANLIAGRLLKIFEKQHPHKEYMMYE